MVIRYIKREAAASFFLSSSLFIDPTTGNYILIFFKVQLSNPYFYSYYFLIVGSNRTNEGFMFIAVNSVVYAVVSPKVEYSLAEKGEEASLIIETIMKIWLRAD